MNATALNNMMNSKLPYWGELVGLSKEDKINLIALLSLSIAEANEPEPRKNSPADRTQEMIDRFCGSWVGDESAEEIIANIEGSRKSHKEPIKF